MPDGRFVYSRCWGGVCGRHHLGADAVDVAVDLVGRSQLDSFLPLDRGDAFPHRAPQPLDLGPLFLVALFKQTQPFAHDFAGVAVGMAGLLRWIMTGMAKIQSPVGGRRIRAARIRHSGVTAGYGDTINRHLIFRGILWQ
jgi:hypothetical protein